MDYGALLGAVMTKQPSTSGAGGGGAQNYAGGGSAGSGTSSASGGMNAGEDFGGASMSGAASSSAGGGSGGGASGGGGGSGSGGGTTGGAGGGGYSGAVADQRQLLSSLKSDNKNKLSTNLDFSGNAGQRGSSFNFGGTQTNAALGAGGGTLKWITLAIAGVVIVVGIWIWKRK